MFTNGFAAVIKAVGHEPLGYYSLVFLILGSICYRVVRNLGKPKPWEVALILAIIMLGFSGVALALVRANNAITAQKEEESKPPSFSAIVKFTGERHSMQPAQVAFRNSSGQVNFGCGDTKPGNVSWNAPAGAEQLNATASWINSDNVGGQEQHVVISGTTATASGTITGRNKDWTGNCPGGGHGELVIQGTYQILQPTPSIPFESLQSGNVSKGKPLLLPLPVEQNLQITACEATVISDGLAPTILKVSSVPVIGSPEAKRDQKANLELIVTAKDATISFIK